MGINIVINGRIYHFSDEEGLIEALSWLCDSEKSSKRANAVLYDDELD